eukprot:scaffold9333_cov119-Isochrysis_galbana.AAC.8
MSRRIAIQYKNSTRSSQSRSQPFPSVSHAVAPRREASEFSGGGWVGRKKGDGCDERRRDDAIAPGGATLAYGWCERTRVISDE